jgi:phosphatidylglycerol---prolipoprotein diacylglyceryl transferase
MYPILLTIGPFRLYSYGVMLGLAFLISLQAAKTRCMLFNIEKDTVEKLFIILILSGIAGARILYILLNLGFFINNPSEVMMINHGGLVFYGGFIFAPIAGAAYVRMIKASILDASDLIAPFAALGHSIGRIGCFLNGCCFGRETDSSFGVCFPGMVHKVYPTQLFSSFSLFLIFLILLHAQKKRLFRGQVVSVYIMLYSFFRFSIEFLRGDLKAVFFSFTATQIVSIFLFITGALMHNLCRKHS